MASRRLRIKAVANLPVRRGRGSEQTLNEPLHVNIDTLVDSQSATSDICILKNSELDKTVDDTETSKFGTVFDDGSSNSSTSSAGYNHSSNMELQGGDEQPIEEPSGNIIENKSKGSDLQGNNMSVIDEPEASSNKSSLRFSRKRVKPPVSLSVATRRPRENKELTVKGQKNVNQSPCGDMTSKRDEDGHEVKERATTSNSANTTDGPMVDESTSTSSHVSRHKEIASVPGITRLIPTGTAIRVQQSKSIEDDKFSVTSEAPQSLPEADLPSEGASGESSALCKFPQPTPRHVDLTFRSSCVHGSGASASESEDDSRKSVSTASTITPPIPKKSEIARPRFRRPSIIDIARRNSLQGSGASASESEDDVKKPLSVATTLSFHGTSVRDVDSDDASPSKEHGYSEVAVNSKEWKKNIRRTDNLKSTRRNGKMSERMLKAKKEFQSKCGGHVPDRSSLTMFDLIYYNPTTNPMKSNLEKEIGEGGEVIGERPDDTVTERLSEEMVDEPELHKEEGEEEEIAMPVPQVKVGPDGQIILDEQSLVIETTGSKKNREDLANSTVVVDYGTGSATYGTYSKKKHKRRKEWPEAETLRFYRALQTLGTDFLLMQSIFPKLSRQDLKAKFKKEEKMNRALVEKALRYPLKFDLTALEKELENQLENEENNLAKATEQKKVVMKKEKVARKKKCSSSPKSFLYRTLNKEDDGIFRNKRKRQTKNDKVQKHPKTAIGRTMNENSHSSDDDDLYDDVQNGISCFVAPEPDDGSQVESGGVDGKDSDSESETDEMRFLSKSPQPTRSGRLTKPRILTDITQDERNASRRKHEKVQNNVTTTSPVNSLDGIPNTFSNMEPGSLFVLASESPLHPGQQIIQVFMVSPHNAQNGSAIPVPVHASFPTSTPVSAQAAISTTPSVYAQAPIFTTPSISAQAPISTTPVFAQAPISTTPVSAQTPISTTPVYAQAPISTTPVFAQAPISTTSVFARAPISTTPVSAQAPISTTPVFAQAPISTTPVSAQAPISTTPVFAQAPISTTPVFAQAPISTTPVSAQAPISTIPSASGYAPVSVLTCMPTPHVPTCAHKQEWILQEIVNDPALHVEGNV